MWSFFFLLTFLIKIRYPRNYAITDIIRTRYGEDTLRLFRKLEKQHERIGKVKLDLQFLKTCLAYNITPKFLQFKVYCRRFQQISTYRKWQFDLLHRDIKLQTRKLKDF